MLLYTKGGKTLMHSDFPYAGNDLSVSINVSDDCDYTGGNFVVYKPHLSVGSMRKSQWHLHRHMKTPYTAQEIGSRKRCHANLFDSKTLHEIEPVTKGKRFVLTLWMKESVPIALGGTEV